MSTRKAPQLCTCPDCLISYDKSDWDARLEHYAYHERVLKAKEIFDIDLRKDVNRKVHDESDFKLRYMFEHLSEDDARKTIREYAKASYALHILACAMYRVETQPYPEYMFEIWRYNFAFFNHRQELETLAKEELTKEIKKYKEKIRDEVVTICGKKYNLSKLPPALAQSMRLKSERDRFMKIDPPEGYTPEAELPDMNIKKDLNFVSPEVTKKTHKPFASTKEESNSKDIATAYKAKDLTGDTAPSIKKFTAEEELYYQELEAKLRESGVLK